MRRCAARSDAPLARTTRASTLPWALLARLDAAFSDLLFWEYSLVGAGTRDIDRLTGMRRHLPWTAAAAPLAALSMAGAIESATGAGASR